MKKYIFPKIRLIELNSEQAVLEVCAVGGLYFLVRTPTPTQCLKGPNTATTYTCEVPIKGQSSGDVSTSTQNAIPS